MPSVEHRQHKYQNNQAENSHQPNQIARAGNATVQISGPRSTLSLSLWNYHNALPSGETSIQSERLSESDESEIRPLGTGDSRRVGCLIQGESLINPTPRSEFISCESAVLLLGEVKLTIS
jgi:hypothetical protein